MCNLSTVSILRWNLVMLLSTLFWFSCSTSDNNEESNGKEGDETNVSVYLQQNGFQNLNRKRLGDAVPPLKKNRSSISSLCFDPTSIFFPFVRQ